jgi:hypothetical protein
MHVSLRGSVTVSAHESPNFSCSRTLFAAPDVTLHTWNPYYTTFIFTIKPIAVHTLWITVFPSCILCGPHNVISSLLMRLLELSILFDFSACLFRKKNGGGGTFFFLVPVGPEGAPPSTLLPYFRNVNVCIHSNLPILHTSNVNMGGAYVSSKHCPSAYGINTQELDQQLSLYHIAIFMSHCSLPLLPCYHIAIFMSHCSLPLLSCYHISIFISRCSLPLLSCYHVSIFISRCSLPLLSCYHVSIFISRCSLPLLSCYHISIFISRCQARLWD